MLSAPFVVSVLSALVVIQFNLLITNPVDTNQEMCYKI